MIDKTNKFERIAMTLIALVAWFGLFLQFYLIMFDPMDSTVPAGQRFVNYFSYFTVLTNLIVAISLTASFVSPASAVGQFSSRTSVRAAVAVYIAVVGLVYSLLLRSVWDPEGLSLVADRVLHDAVPILYVLYWFIFVGKAELNWSTPAKWLLYPLLYMAYSLIRGAFVGWYPYHFADAAQLGYQVAIRNAALVVVGFFVVGVIFVGIGKLMSRTANSVAS